MSEIQTEIFCGDHYFLISSWIIFSDCGSSGVNPFKGFDHLSPIACVILTDQFFFNMKNEYLTSSYTAHNLEKKL